MIKTYKDLKGRKWEGDGIPKWIFKTGPYTIETLPRLIKRIYLNMETDNVGYELFFFSDEDCVDFIREEYGEYYLHLYEKLKPGAYKADLWRYMILLKYGGIYGDFSQIMVMKFDDVIENCDRVFCIDEPWSVFSLHNAFMATKPDDEVLKKVLDSSFDMINKSEYGSDPLDITGPVILGKSYNYILNPEKDVRRPIKYGMNGKDKILIHPNDGDIHIKDINGNNVLCRKISNHFDYMYNHDVHYGHHWHKKTVYNY
jgi:hypothetical protein